jgi:hypothetical protein
MTGHNLEIWTRRANRQDVTRLKRPAIERTDAAHDACRSTAEFDRHVKPTGNGKRRARTAAPGAESQSLSAANDEWLPYLQDLPIYAGLKSSAVYDASCRIGRLEFRADQRDFQCRRVGVVAEDSIGEPM